MMSDVGPGDRATATIRRRARAAEAIEPQSPRDGRRLVAYDPIARLTIRHEYYGPQAGGFALRVAPSFDTRQRLNDRGLLFRAEPDGCVILAERPRRHYDPRRRLTWATLLIHALDEHFGPVSDVDFDARQRPHCAYVTNQRSSGEGRGSPVESTVLPVESTVLPVESTVLPVESTVLNVQRLPVLPIAFDEAIQPGETIEVFDREGRLMWLEWPAGSVVPLPSEHAIRCNPNTRRARIDLSAASEGRYHVRTNGRAVREGVRLAGPRMPDVLAELVLPDPHDVPGSRDQKAGAPGGCLDYQIVFAARCTIWKYWIVPRTGNGPLDNLSIDVAGNGVGTAPGFLGPFEETLPNGTRAYSFLAAAPIALRRRSPVRLRLTGRRRERMTRDGVLVDCLPVPAQHQLSLMTGRDIERLGRNERFCSEMFVYV